MTRIKKPAVRPEQRREWFRRHEEIGESAPEIARADGYDVRTVRKNIEIESQEKERREARSVVLRQALEQHYSDLCNFAQKLDSHIISEAGSLGSLREDPMWSALRVHILRSTLWRNLEKWETSWQKIDDLDKTLKNKFQMVMSDRTKLKFSESDDEIGLDVGVIDALAFHFHSTARGLGGLDKRIDFTTSPSGRGVTAVHYGAYVAGRIPADRVSDIKDTLLSIFSEIKTREEHKEVGRLHEQLTKLQRELHEELLTITLRRIVPGRCKYCPL